MTKAYPVPLSLALRAALFTHLGAMEKAGLPTDKSFALLKLPAPAATRVDAARKLLVRGKDIATAGQLSGLFSELEAQLVRAATSAGSPALTYRRLALSYTQKARLNKAIKSRMMLPLAVFMLSLFLQPLPAFIAGTLTPAAYLWGVLRPIFVVAGLAILIKCCAAWLNSAAPAPIRNKIESCLQHIPLFRAMYVKCNVRDFFESLALMLEAGLPMFEALPQACKAISNERIRVGFSRTLPKMQQGATLAEALRGVAYLGDRQVIELIDTGENSGSLPEMLWHHSNLQTEAIAHFQQQVADWLPRMVYGAVMLWVAYGILTGAAFMPDLPAE